MKIKEHEWKELDADFGTVKVCTKCGMPKSIVKGSYSTMANLMMLDWIEKLKEARKHLVSGFFINRNYETLIEAVDDIKEVIKNIENNFPLDEHRDDGNE